MTTTHLVVVEENGRARVHEARITLIKEREIQASCPISKCFREAIENAQRCAARALHELGLNTPAEQVQSSGIRLQVDTTDLLEGGSGGTSVAVAIVLDVLGVPNRSNDFIASAALSLSGELTPVAGIDLKVGAASHLGRKLLTASPTPYYHPDVLCSVSSLVEAVMLFAGSDGLRAILQALDADESRIQTLNIFARTHFENGHYPIGLRPTDDQDPLVGLQRRGLRAQVHAALAPLALRCAMNGEHCFDLLVALFPEASWAEGQAGDALDLVAARAVEEIRLVIHQEALPVAVGVHIAAGILAAVSYAYKWSLLRDVNSPLSHVFTAMINRYSLDRERFSGEVVAILRDRVGLRSGNVLFGLNEEVPLVLAPDLLRVHVNYLSKDPWMELASLAFEIPGVVDPRENHLTPPILLWGDERLSALPGIEEIAERFGRGTLIDFGSLVPGFHIIWRDGRGVWPPSIDAMHFVRDLHSVLPQDQHRWIADVGCGTGVIGLAALRLAPALEQLHFCDLLAAARRTCGENLFINSEGGVYDEEGERLDPAERPFKTLAAERVRVKLEGREVRVRFHEAPAHQALPWILEDLPAEAEGKLDLVLMAPPYMPQGLGSWDAVFSTGLLDWAVSRGGSFCREMLINVSDVASRALRKAVGLARESGEVNFEELPLPPSIVGFRDFDFMDLGVARNDEEGRECAIQKLLQSTLTEVLDRNDRASFHQRIEEMGLAQVPVGCRFFHRIRTYRIWYGS